MTKYEWQDDHEYLECVADLLNQPAVQKLAQYTQHHYSNRLEHSLRVSYLSYKIAKKCHAHAREVARAGLLHDLFYYDWRTTKFDLGTHAWIHPRIAVRNAEKITHLTARERDIIIKHMWGATIAPPRYFEGYIVTWVDKYAATKEAVGPLLKKASVKLHLINE